MKRIAMAVVVLIVASSAAFAVEGKEVYDKKCKTCHSYKGEAGPMAKMGGSLDDVASKHDNAWLMAYLKDPKSKVPNAKMPKLNLSDDELTAVTTYLTKKQ